MNPVQRPASTSDARKRRTEPAAAQQRDVLIDDLIDVLGWDWPEDPDDPNVPPLREAVGDIVDELVAKGWSKGRTS